MTTYRILVFYEGPKVAWSGKAEDTEVIADMTVEVPFLYLARLGALSSCGNTGRCGYVILSGQEIVDQMKAPNSAYPE